MSNTMMAIILIVYVIVLAVLAWNNHKLSKLARSAVNMAGDVIDNADALTDMVVAWEHRDKEIAKLFAGILFDLSHATDKNVLQWKLAMLRNVGFLMGITGYEEVYDDNYYTWLMNTLTKLPKNIQVAQLEKVRDAVKGYYIMDPDVGTNFCDMIADIINMNDDLVEVHGTYLKTYKALIDSLNSTDLELLVADMDRRSDASPADLRANLFDALSQLRQTCADATKLVKEYTEAMADDKKEADDTDVSEEDSTGEESPEPCQTEEVHADEVPGEADPVVQGETDEKPDEDAAPVRPEVPEVELTDTGDTSARTGVEVIMGKKRI